MPGRRRAAAKPVEEEVFEELDELEEPAEADEDLEELEEEAPPPAKRTRAKKAAAPVKKTPAADTGDEFDTNWLAEFVSEETGTRYDSRAIRMLLRKLAKNGAFAREIGEDRSRYTFPKGANDPIVRAVLKMVNSGEAAAMQREGLDNLKAKRAKAAAPAKKTAPTVAKKATKAAAAPARTRRRAAAQ